MPISTIIAMTIHVGLVLALLTAWFLWRRTRAQGEREREALTTGGTAHASGTEYPIRGAATRAGFLRGSYSKNSINPHFTVESNALSIRILKTWHVPFGSLLHIDARKTLTGMALIFHIAEANRIFIVRFGDAALARTALSRIAPTVPLTEDAALLRDGNACAATPRLRRYGGPLN